MSNSELPDDTQHPSLGFGSPGSDTTHAIRRFARWLEWTMGCGHEKQGIQLDV